jgi:hypothetical protein
MDMMQAFLGEHCAFRPIPLVSSPTEDVERPQVQMVEEV